MEEFYVYSEATLSSFTYFTLNGVRKQSTNASINTSTGIVYLADAFYSAYTPDGTPIIIELGGMRNPISLKPTVSAIAATSDDDGYSIDNVSTGLTLTMTTINELNSFNVSPSSTTNGDVADYTFTINSESPLRSSDKI